VKAAELVEILRLSNVEVKVASSAFTSPTAHTYLENNAHAASKTFPAGSYIIDLDQPQRIYIKAVMEQDTPQDKAFVEDNMARFRRNQMRGKGQSKEDYGFYDITAWSLPLGFRRRRLVDRRKPECRRRNGRQRVSRKRETRKRFGPCLGKLHHSIRNGHDRCDGHAACCRADSRSPVATRQLNAGGRNWRPGTFVVRVSRNPETITTPIAKLAREMGVNVLRVNSGYSDEGDTSVGGEAGDLAERAKDRRRGRRRHYAGIVRLALVDVR
jgi:hypothetical protein